MNSYYRNIQVFKDTINNFIDEFTLKEALWYYRKFFAVEIRLLRQRRLVKKQKRDLEALNDFQRVLELRKELKDM